MTVVRLHNMSTEDVEFGWVVLVTLSPHETGFVGTPVFGSKSNVSPDREHQVDEMVLLPVKDDVFDDFDDFLVWRQRIVFVIMIYGHHIPKHIQT